MGKASELRQLLKSRGTLAMPDAYDPISAQIIERLGFKAVQCSGYSFALAACWPSEAELGRERNASPEVIRKHCEKLDRMAIAKRCVQKRLQADGSGKKTDPTAPFFARRREFGP